MGRVIETAKIEVLLDSGNTVILTHPEAVQTYKLLKKYLIAKQEQIGKFGKRPPSNEPPV